MIDIDIDIDDTNAALDRLTSSMFHVEAPELRNRARDIAGIARMALDELEASRKSPMVALFDTTEARAELARIDRAWASGDDESRVRAFDAARALLDKALAAIDAGWEPADVPTVRGIIGRVRDVIRDEPNITPAGVVEEFEREVNRLPLRGPVAISDAVVEEAARRAYMAPAREGIAGGSPDVWDRLDPRVRRTMFNETRAVIEYVASLGGVASVDKTYPLAPAFDPTRDRREAFRAIMQGYASNERAMYYVWTEADNRGDDFNAWLVARADALVNAMLAAEKKVPRG